MYTEYNFASTIYYKHDFEWVAPIQNALRAQGLPVHDMAAAVAPSRACCTRHKTGVKLAEHFQVLGVAWRQHVESIVCLH